MAGSAVGMAIGELSNNIRSVVADHFPSMKQKSEEALLFLKLVANDAEQKQRSEGVKEWFEKLQDAVYRTEDVVDEIRMKTLNHRLDATSTKNSWVMALLYQSKWVEIFHVWEDKVEKGLRINMMEIFNELKSLEMQGRKLNLKTDWEEPGGLSTASFIDDSEVFGRDVDKKTIIDKLYFLDDASGEWLPVIPIVAEDGMGKTTLARLVYNDHRVSKRFDLKAWATAWVPGVEGVFPLAKAIYESFTSQSCDLKDLSLLEDRLYQSLKNKRFLLVLDDVSAESFSYCYRLLSRLIGAAAKGSRIIGTTIPRAGKTIMRNNNYNPSRVVTQSAKPLSDEECWSIFVKFAFGNKDPSLYPELEAIGKKIVQECHGVPLVIRTLGALLFFKLEVDEWQAILQYLTPCHQSEMYDPYCALGLGYHYLPPHLKRCFAYCSIFPRAYEFEKEKLILLWMAEGLLQQTERNLTMEEVGDYYFRELLYRSFFLRSSVNESHFVIHNLMNDLAINISGEFCFKLEDNSSLRISERARHLSLLGKCDSSMIFEAIDKAKFLRTFLPLHHESCHLSSNELQDLFSKLQFLRVLSLSHYQIHELPDSIGEMKPLRYIDLSHTAIKILPESVCALCNLQTLILSNCYSLIKFPEEMWKLSNLRHLHIGGTNLSEMPKGLSKLENLQTLSNFVVGKESGLTVKELGGLLNLHGTLSISRLQNAFSPADAAEAKLAEKTKLDELVLEWGDDIVDPDDDRRILEQLVPHINLKKLTINFYHGTKFPNWLGHSSFSNMVFLCLRNCKECLYMPPLGQLPSLEVLIIEWMIGMKTVGPDFFGANMRFQSLKSLTFDGMLGWEEWISPEVHGGEFPCLQELCIRRCPKLKGNLPKQLPSVEKVEISESQKLVTAITKEASLHYHDKILYISDDKVVTSLENLAESSLRMIEGVSESSFPMMEGVSESSLRMIEGVSESSFPMMEGVSESSFAMMEGESSFHMMEGVSESSFPVMEGVSESSFAMMEGESSFHMMEGVSESSFPMMEGVSESSFPMIQGVESSFPMTQTPNVRDEVDVPTKTWSNQDGLQDFTSLESMKVSKVSQLIDLPVGLHTLKIEGCDALEDITEGVIKNNPSLQNLYIIDCYSLKSLPEVYPTTALKVLYIQNCKRLNFLSHATKTYQYALLEHLCIGSSCDPLRCLQLGFFPKIRSLSIWDCANLESLTMPEGIQISLTSLEALEIRDCPKFKSFPEGGLPTPNLTSIWFSNCKSLKELPKQLHTLSSLQSMSIYNCPELVSLSEWGLPSNLCLLCITSCNKLMLGREWGLHRLGCLSQLEIEGGCKNVESFPEEELLPSNLNSLSISGLLNLKYLNYRGLQHLTALQTLEISCCDELQSLPEEGLPSSLSFLCIKECSLLKENLLNKKGKDWSNMAHISCIEIDEELIKDRSEIADVSCKETDEDVNILEFEAMKMQFQ